MPRVKRGKIATKKREKILRRVKGFKWGRKAKERLAKEALLHAGKHAFRERKRKKREFRRLWQIKINAAARKHGLTYSQFMQKLHASNIELNRKILADFSQNQPQIFAKIVEELSRSTS